MVASGIFPPCELRAVRVVVPLFFLSRLSVHLRVGAASGNKTEILVIIPEREFILPQGIYYQNFRELSGKRICSDTERRARNPVVGSERAQSHHDTEWDEARGKSKSRSCAVV